MTSCTACRREVARHSRLSAWPSAPATRTAAADLGATTRREDRAGLLRSLGADEVVTDNGQIAAAVRGLVPGGVDRVLDLVGNSVLRDSLKAVRVNGRLCQAGFLGGLAPADQFLPIADMPSGVQFSFFGSFEVETDAFPLPAIPLQSIVGKAEAGDYIARPSRIFAFEDVPEVWATSRPGQMAGRGRLPPATPGSMGGFRATEPRPRMSPSVIPGQAAARASNRRSASQPPLLAAWAELFRRGRSVVPIVVNLTVWTVPWC